MTTPNPNPDYELGPGETLPRELQRPQRLTTSNDNDEATQPEDDDPESQTGDEVEDDKISVSQPKEES